jgi:hypothetical protein
VLLDDDDDVNYYDYAIICERTIMEHLRSEGDR